MVDSSIELNIDINRTSTIPLHYQLANELKRLIKEKQLTDSCLLTEGYLEKKLNLSRNTVRQAISNLVKEGWVIKKRAMGIRVVESSSELIEEKVHGLSFTDAAIKIRKQSSVKGIVSKIIDPPKFLIKVIPDISTDEKIFYTKRLRFLDLNPVCIVEHYLRAVFAPEISEKDFSEQGSMQSFHNILEKKYGLGILEWNESISVAQASQSDSEFMGIEVGSPLLVKKDVTFSTEGNIIFFSVHRFIAKYEIAGLIIFKERL